MILTTTVSNSNGNFLIRTVDTSANIEFGTGYETQVHPIINGEANIYKLLEYKYSGSKSEAFTAHQKIVDKWRKI